MNSDYIYIETNQYQTEAPKWLEAIKRQENVTVLFVPKTDRLIRLGHLLSDKDLISKVLGSYEDYKFLQLHIDPEDITELSDVSLHIAEYLNSSKITSSTFTFDQWVNYFTRNSLKLILVLPEAETYLNPQGKHVLSLFSLLTERYAPLIRILSLFEADLTHSSNLEFMPTSTRLYENIFPYSLYDLEDTLRFIQILEKLWNLNLPEKTKSKIIDKTGGHFWLVKQAIREVKSIGSWKVKSEGMMFRLRTVFNCLSVVEQEVIRKCITRKEILESKEQLSLQHLKKMRIVDENEKCLIGGFTDLLSQPQLQAVDISLRDNRIFINEVPVDKLFTKQERRVLKLLLEYGNHVVSRDEIAKRMWLIKTLEKYSDWAIDQLMSRIRKGLQDLLISPKIIEAVRGKGYIMTVHKDSL